MIGLKYKPIIGGIFLMFDKKSIDNFLKNNDNSSLYRIARSDKFNPADLIFDSNYNRITKEPPSIYINKSSIHGLGVFTSDPIMVAQTIEQCFCIPLEFKNKYHHDKNLISYSYSLLQDNDDHGKTLYLLTGYGMIYNHMDTPNAKLVFDKNSNICSVIATQLIKENQEITINYYQYK